MVEGRAQYKDRLFSFLFGSEENKVWTLSLYNAVNGSDYDDPSAIEITTIKGVMYLGMHNDVSFLIANEMALYEQQSTYNPNMPLRMLQYAGNLYEKHIKQNKLNKYGNVLLKLPVPKLVVFYNGRTEQPEEAVLRLADSFPCGADADISVKVRLLNVNVGKNEKLLKACRPLGEYSWLVDEVRAGAMGNNGDLASVIDGAISAMPSDFLIKPFLEAHRAEVNGMLLTEYDEAEQMELFKRDARIEGLAEGRKEGRLEVLLSLALDGELPIEVAAPRAGMTEDEFRQAMCDDTLPLR